MITYLFSVLGLALLCGCWYVVQRWVAKHDPDAPGVEGSCGCGSLGKKRGPGNRSPQ